MKTRYGDKDEGPFVKRARSTTDGATQRIKLELHSFDFIVFKQLIN